MSKESLYNGDISITKICNNAKISMRIYGPHSMNEDGTIMPFDEQMAIVSHYLHNYGYKSASPFETKAKGLIERDNGTFQGRLIQELRLNNITTIQQATIHIQEDIQQTQERLQPQQTHVIGFQAPIEEEGYDE